jgi:hypothetical protein
MRLGSRTRDVDSQSITQVFITLFSHPGHHRRWRLILPAKVTQTSLLWILFHLQHVFTIIPDRYRDYAGIMQYIESSTPSMRSEEEKKSLFQLMIDTDIIFYIPVCDASYSYADVSWDREREREPYQKYALRRKRENCFQFLVDIEEYRC